MTDRSPSKRFLDRFTEPFSVRKYAMGYKGGGKLWVEPKGLGWVALERDWEEDLLPRLKELA